MSLSNSTERLRTAFYPCCAGDIEAPRTLLAGVVDQIIFCDISASVRRHVTRAEPSDALPRAVALQGDALTAIPSLPQLDVLFYRGDSDGEGGSRLMVLGHVFLRPLLVQHGHTLRLVITDGSNSRGNNFKKMTRSTGLQIEGRWLRPAAEQPWQAELGLWAIEVLPASLASS